MTRPSELAAHYGTSTTFVRQALAQLGIATNEDDNNVSQAVVERFEASFGPRIRASRPVPPSTITAEDERLRPHVMRTAYAKATGRRNTVTWAKEKALLDPPGIAHALDAAGTWEGDPWGGLPSDEVRSIRSRLSIIEPHFYDQGGPSAACGVQLRALVADEFDVDAPEACPHCAEIVAAGRGYRYRPAGRRPRCPGYLRVKNGNVISVLACIRLGAHSEPHQALSGETWPIDANGAAVLADG